mmetsp:Transcript_126345/g.252468  ORF Transcript_126345/g.252468 Transcript_126345/m.252468 type:complete len:88 (+) Transcript_126345:147-410(+)
MLRPQHRQMKRYAQTASKNSLAKKTVPICVKVQLCCLLSVMGCIGMAMELLQKGLPVEAQHHTIRDDNDRLVDKPSPSYFRGGRFCL